MFEKKRNLDNIVFLSIFRFIYHLVYILLLYTPKALYFKRPVYFSIQPTNEDTLVNISGTRRRHWAS